VDARLMGPDQALRWVSQRVWQEARFSVSSQAQGTYTLW